MVSTRSYHNCCTVEKLIMQQLANAIEPNQLASLAKALDTILERKRILRMRPAPKAVDVSGPKKHKPKTGLMSGLSIVPAPTTPTTTPDAAPTPGSQTAGQ